MPGGGDPAALLVIEDVTEILRGQRLEAWAEMARIIAHEVKNPLTPIRLSTEHMQQVFETDPERFEAVFERCTKNILNQVDELREIAARVLDLPVGFRPWTCVRAISSRWRPRWSKGT